MFSEIDMTRKVDPFQAASKLGDVFRILGGYPAGDPFSPTQSLEQTAEQATDQTVQNQEAAAAETGDKSFGYPTQQHYAITGGFNESRPGHRHAGVDMAVPMGTAVLAAAPGKVLQVNTDGQGGGYGNFVLIDHGGGLVTRYAHLSSSSMTPGATVGGGQVIGISGSTGHSTGPHLHFETIQDGTPVDPTPYLAGGFNVIGKENQDPTGEPQLFDPAEIGEAQKASIQELFGTPEYAGGTAPARPGTRPRRAAKQAPGQPEVAPAEGGDMFSQILAGVGAPATPENRRALQAWAQAEGMKPEHNNPFATTWDTGTAGSINSAGVKHYANQGEGVMATVNTLKNYSGILSALRSGNNALAVADAIANSPWGTGGLVRKILQGGGGGEEPAPSSAPPAKKRAQTQPQRSRSQRAYHQPKPKPSGRRKR